MLAQSAALGAAQGAAMYSLGSVISGQQLTWSGVGSAAYSGVANGVFGAGLGVAAYGAGYAIGSMTRNTGSLSQEKVIAEVSNDIVEADRMGSALKTDQYHSINDIIDNYAGLAKKTTINNGMLYQIEGSFNGIDGRFEWIIDSGMGKYPGKVSHRLFVPTGKIVGGR